MNVPLVSVIVPTYNAGKFIDDMVKSILNQTYQNIELIIVDDGSTDNTKNILEKYNTQIKYLYQDNQGPSEARNTGINAANGEIIAYHDADDISLPNRIAREVVFLLDNPKYSMVYTGMTNIYVDGHVEKRPSTPYNPFLLLQTNYISCGTVMHWKDILDDVGMWNENIDWDLWIRISEKFQIGRIEECLYNRRIHAHNISLARGRLKNRLIDLQMFKDRYNRKKEWWMYFKVKRVSVECELIKTLNFKNKRAEMIFFTCSNILFNKIEEMIYLTCSPLQSARHDARYKTPPFKYNAR
jgi:glycosyltransferase involved in cell wall biosynthesis